MKRILMILLVVVVATQTAIAEAARPNVLLISIDDLNDWVGVLGGHPQAKTPHLDTLANRGTLFANAHCQAPVCNPSRVSLMTSRYPSSTGVYFLNPPIQQSPFEQDVVTLPQRFATDGYDVFAAGKLFHHKDNAKYFPKYAGTFGGFGPTPEKKISQPHGHPLWDWGAYPDQTEKMPDDKVAEWAVEQLGKDYDKPFFMGVGFFRPHVPMYVPQEWFEQHPRDQIELPEIRENDRDDLSPYARDLTTLEHVAPLHSWVTESGEWDHTVQAYLASTTFVDACVGKVLDALANSPHADNTIVVVFSDHGFHLGEKERWAKRSLWEDGTRVPLIVLTPGQSKATRVTKPAELIDIYPTLLELCGLDADTQLEGQSLVPLLKNASAPWEFPARTTFGPGNHSIRSEHFRYIRYNDGSEELYDHRVDPHEWTNLAGDSKYEKIIAEHRKWLPKHHAPILGKDSTGHIAFAAAEANR